SGRLCPGKADTCPVDRALLQQDGRTVLYPQRRHPETGPQVFELYLRTLSGHCVQGPSAPDFAFSVSPFCLSHAIGIVDLVGGAWTGESAGTVTLWWRSPGSG